jgi:hypothetical protein
MVQPTITTTEQAFAALFALLKLAKQVGAVAAPGKLPTPAPVNTYAFRTAERDIRRWDQVDKLGEAGLPAIFQEEKQPRFESGPNMATIVRLDVDLAIVCQPTDPEGVPSTALNALVDAVLAALRPDPSDDQRQTLGGLVYDCKPTGDGWYREATRTDSFAYALIPVQILLYA